MKKSLITLALLSSSVLLTGCQSYFGDKGFFTGPQDRYSASKNGRILTIPAPLSSARISHDFVIPEGTHQASPVPPPPGSTLAKQQQK